MIPSLRTRADAARKQIKTSRVLIVLALCLIVVATGIAWLTVRAPAKQASVGQNALVQTTAGAECGTLTRSGRQVKLTIGSAAAVPIPDNAKVTLIDSCP